MVHSSCFIYFFVLPFYKWNAWKRRNERNKATSERTNHEGFTGWVFTGGSWLAYTVHLQILLQNPFIMSHIILVHGSLLALISFLLLIFFCSFIIFQCRETKRENNERNKQNKKKKVNEWREALDYNYKSGSFLCFLSVHFILIKM